MPKAALYSKFKSKTRRNLHHLFSDAKRECGLTSEEIGEVLKKTDVAVRQQMTRPDDMWRIGEIKQYCSLLHVELSDALNSTWK